ncbi:unnamed protein product, partial [marine sediment metagenome]
KQTFRPELLNRIDDVIIFHPLTEEQLRSIVDLLVRETERRLAERDIKLDIKDEAKVWLVPTGGLGGFPDFGFGGLGDNAKAAFITQSWAELVSLGVALGAKASTFYGLAGLGDLIATCASTLSRNHYVGYELAKGRSLKEIAASMSQVAEGVHTTMAAHQLGHKLNLETPIANLIYRVLFEDFPLTEAIAIFTGSTDAINLG